MPVECLVHQERPLLPPGLVRRAQRLPSALISDVSGRWAGAPGLLPVAGLSPGQVVAGPAFTVRTRPGDNLVVHKALDLVRNGEIVVVDAGGHPDRAILGGLMGHYARTREVAALVVDGAVRDQSELNRLAPPVFAAAVTHLGPYKDGPGALRCPVSIAGVAVADGDLIVADEDGVAVVPRDQIEEIIADAERKRAAEQAEFAAISAGTWDRSWIDLSLTLRPAPKTPESIRTANERVGAPEMAVDPPANRRDT